MPSGRDLLPLLRDIRAHLFDDVSLARLAALAGWSPAHLHRAFRRVTGETPKQYTLRLRLERAATALATSDARVLDVALMTGFDSHEVFARAFRRHFGRTPSVHRARAMTASAATRAQHGEAAARVGPCVGLFRLPLHHTSRRPTMPTLSITRAEIPAQPVLFVQLRTARHELPKAIADGIGRSYGHAQKAGLALAGHPFTRYRSTGPGLLTIEAGLPLATSGTGEGDVEATMLPGGPCAIGLHAGPYEQLDETYAAIERWIEANGFRAAGAPWESYITDPADHPDPADWRTAVHWPLAE